MGQQEEWPWESRKGLLCGIPWSTGGNGTQCLSTEGWALLTLLSQCKLCALLSPFGREMMALGCSVGVELTWKWKM